MRVAEKGPLMELLRGRVNSTVGSADEVAEYGVLLNVIPDGDRIEDGIMRNDS